MGSWHEVVEAKGLKTDEMTHGRAGGEDVLVVNTAGAWHAYINRCGHMNAPLDLGTFKSGVLKCPQHNAVFDARTGAVRGQPVHAAMPGLEQLPAEFKEALARMGPIFARIECKPLAPLPIEVSNDSVRVFV
ncbi:MAG: Rieske (2Fe-2S) protein [Thermoplasmata archaeon]|nr:Rieske (2Fe-2S) protein [Thermoplasmata archaeon]